MKQVIIIHGGNSFNSYESYIEDLANQEIDFERLRPQKKWKTDLPQQMPDADVLLPTFPNRDNAVYNEWKIYFEKLVPFFGDDVRLVGHSLGAMFLAIYLNENKLPKTVRQLILIAGGYNDESIEDYGSFKVETARGASKNAEKIHLFHSKDDPVVPFTELAKYQADLPNAVSHVFEDRGHFNSETFPELLELLKQK